MSYQISTFSVDITPPMGTPLCGGAIEPVLTVDDPQFARGYVLLEKGKQPIVQVAFDCVGTYNDTHDQIKKHVAAAASTIPERVIVSSVHQHDAPIYDVTAQKLLDSDGLRQVFCSIEAMREAVRSIRRAVRRSLEETVEVTHIGTGQAKVRQVASNRRILNLEGRVGEMRGSACTNPALRDEPEGLIDPMLKCLTFFSGNRPVVTVSHYATHPMSYYGKGGVSADFCGLARAKRQADDPDCFQIYVTGCAGNIAAGKYNDGSAENRPVLMGRMYDAMASAAASVTREPLESVKLSLLEMQLPVRDDPWFTREHALDVLEGKSEMSTDWRRAAMCLSWRRRARLPVDLQMLDMGSARVLLLPGEPFVEYQLAAQQMEPDDFLMVLGYGNGGPGYLCTDVAYRQGGYEAGESSLAGPGSELILHESIRQILSR